MFIFDAHNDTLLQLMTRKLNDLASLENTHVNLSKMQAAGMGAQIFAVYVPETFLHGLALQTALKMIDIFWLNMEKHQKYLQPILWSEDLPLHNRNQIGCLLSIEGGEALEGSLANLRNLFRLGVRGLTLTWNFRNELGDGIGEGERAKGLSKFGFEVVAEMNRLGMLVDVSHLAEPGFWDVVQISKKPIIASHSNAYALCQHPRNLTDAQIRAIADSGGVIGVNFYTGFLANSPEQADIDTVVDHIIYLMKIGGTDVVGLGSDFDGIDQTPQGLENIALLPQLVIKLKNKGCSETIIEKVMGNNFLRVLQEVLPKKSS